jgi:hypothetical protein
MLRASPVDRDMLVVLLLVRPTAGALLNDRAPNDLLKALLFWAAYSQFPGCESVKWGLIEKVVMDRGCDEERDSVASGSTGGNPATD